MLRAALKQPDVSSARLAMLVALAVDCHPGQPGCSHRAAIAAAHDQYVAVERSRVCFLFQPARQRFGADRQPCV
ncbi:MAG: hypothetical protein A2X72_12545 [Burkholderiales bacterium GWF1_66_17]|nr:MAG: hypothetical protein A2X72_12545 [Burkholderiales bacterium GWF1_66_17]